MKYKTNKKAMNAYKHQEIKFLWNMLLLFHYFKTLKKKCSIYSLLCCLFSLRRGKFQIIK